MKDRATLQTFTEVKRNEIPARVKFGMLPTCLAPGNARILVLEFVTRGNTKSA